MPIAKWIEQRWKRRKERAPRARRPFRERFSLTLDVKELESRLVLSGGPVMTELALVGGDLFINDVAPGGKNDQLTLQADFLNDRLTIHDPTAILSVSGFLTSTLSPDCHTVEVSLEEISGTIFVNTLGGNDSLTLDYMFGANPVPIEYAAGGSPGDKLFLQGNAFATSAYELLSPSAGTIALTDNGTISYQGVAQVTDQLLHDERTFSFSTGDETITLATSGGLNQLLYDLGGPDQGRIDFLPSVNTLAIAAGGGDDQLNLVGIIPGWNGNLFVSGDGGNDTLQVTDPLAGPFVVLNGEITISAESVTVDKPLVSQKTFVTADALQVNHSLVGVQEILLSPDDATDSIGLGTSSGSFNLSASEIGFLFSNGSVTIGRPDGTGTVEIGTVNITQPYHLTLLGGDTTFLNDSPNAGGIALTPGRILTLAVGNISSPNSGIDVSIANGLARIVSQGSIGSATDPLTLAVNYLETDSSAANGDQFLRNANTSSPPIFLAGGPFALSGLNAGTGTIHLLDSVFVLNGNERIADASRLVFSGNLLVVGNFTETVRQFTLQNGTVVGGPPGTIHSVDTIQLENGVVQVALTGNSGLTKSTSGTVQLLQPASYPGNTEITAGTLLLGAAEVIPHGLGAGNVAISAGATLDLNGFQETINGLSGAGTVVNNVNNVPFFVGADDSSSTFDGSLTGAMALIKVGAGTFTLAGVNTHTIATNVAAGTLLVTGTTTANTFVQNDAELGGNGDGVTTGLIAGSVTVNGGGTLAPGVTIGKLTTGNLLLNSGSIFAATIDGNVAGITHDQLAVQGTVNLANATLDLSGTLPRAGDNQIVLIDNDGGDDVVGQFAGLPEGAIVPFNGTFFRISYRGGTGNDVVLAADTLVSLNLGTLQITDINSTTDDRLTIFADAANSQFVITDPGRILGTTIGGATGDGSSTIFVPFHLVTANAIEVNTLAGDDLVTLDYSLGPITSTVQVAGGTDTGSPADQLQLVGPGLFTSIVHTFTSADSGSLTISGQGEIFYTELEALTDHLQAQEREFHFEGGSETIVSADHANAGMNRIDSTLGIDLSYRIPLTTLVIDAGNGDDSLVWNPLDPAISPAALVQLSGGSGANELKLNTLPASNDRVEITATSITQTHDFVSKPNIAYADFAQLSVNTFAGDDEIKLHLGGPLPTTVLLDGGSEANSDRVELIGDLLAADQLRLHDSQLTDLTTGKTVAFVGIENIRVDLAGDNLDDALLLERTFGLAGANPMLDIVGDGAPYDRLTVNTELSLFPTAADMVELTAQSVNVTGWLPIQYVGLNEVTLNTGGGDDFIRVAPALATQLVVNAGAPQLPAVPGDTLEFDLTGIAAAELQLTGPGSGVLLSDRRDVLVSSSENFSALMGQQFAVSLDADARGNNEANDGGADEFTLSRQGSQTLIAVQGQTVFRGEQTALNQILLSGSSDDDAVTVDFAGGNPLPVDELHFDGLAGTNSLQLIQGSVERVVHDVLGPQSADIRVQEFAVARLIETHIHYENVTEPLLDDLQTNTRELHLTSAVNQLQLLDHGGPADDRTQIVNAGAATFLNLIQRNPTETLIITGGNQNDTFFVQTVDQNYSAETILQGNAGNDEFFIDSNGAAAGGTTTFVTFPISIVGGTDDFDRLWVNDSSNTADALLQITEATIDFGPGSVNYRGLEALAISLGSGNDEVIVTDDPAINADPEANAAFLFQIETGSGNDQVRFNSIDAGFRATTHIDGGLGDDEIHQQADLQLGSTAFVGELNFTAEEIFLAGDLQTNGGDARYIGNITLEADVRIDTAPDTSGGLISVQGTVQSAINATHDFILDAGEVVLLGDIGSGPNAALGRLVVEHAERGIAFGSTLFPTQPVNLIFAAEGIDLGAAAMIDGGISLFGGNTPLTMQTAGNTVRLNGPTTLRSDVHIDTDATDLGTSGGLVLFNSRSPLNATPTNPGGLSIDAGTATVSFNAEIGAVPLAYLTIEQAAAGIIFGGGDVASPLHDFGPVAAITTLGPIDLGQGNQTILGAGIIFNGGSELPISSEQGIRLNGAVELQSDLRIFNNSTSDEVLFTAFSPINSQAGERNSLRITSAGNVSFNADLGVLQPLELLFIEQAPTISFGNDASDPFHAPLQQLFIDQLFLEEAQPNVRGTASFNGGVSPVVLQSMNGFIRSSRELILVSDLEITLLGTPSPTDWVEFFGPIDSGTLGPRSLSITAGGRDVFFYAELGQSQPLQNLRLSGTDDLTFSAPLQLTGNLQQLAGTGVTLFEIPAGANIGGNLQMTTGEIQINDSSIVVVLGANLSTSQALSLLGTSSLQTGDAVTLAVNTDLLGSEGLHLDPQTSIQTASNAPSAILITIGGSGDALLSLLETGATSGVELTAGGAIFDNTPTEDPNVISQSAALTAGAGIGIPFLGDLNLQVEQLTANSAAGDIIIHEVNDLLLTGLAAQAGRVEITAGGLLTIQNHSSAASFSGQVSNIPPLLRVGENNPDDVILPGDPTQEIRGTIGGDELLGDNQELGRNLTFTIFWADGVVSTVTGLNAGDSLTWFVGPGGASTPQITPGNTNSGPINVFVQRQYPLTYLQTVTAPEIVSQFVVSNDANVLLRDQRPINLGVTLPFPVATAVAEAEFRPPPIIFTSDKPTLVEIRRPSLLVEVSSVTTARTVTYEETTTVQEEGDEEEAQLYLVFVSPDGTEGPRVKLPLAELRNLSGLLDRLKQAPIPSGLYRIYHQEPGLTSRQLIEFRKAGKTLGDPIREPGRGSNPLEEQKPRADEKQPPRQENVAPQDEQQNARQTEPPQQFTRLARWRRQWET